MKKSDDIDFYIVWRPGLPIPHQFGLEVKGYMVSVTHYFNKECNDLHDVLNFDGPIIVDSGAFFFGKRGNFPSPKEVYDHQIKLGADIIVPLDYPLLFAKKNQTQTFINKTIKNNILWMEYAKNKPITVFGVIQGKENDIQRVVNKIESNYLALGGKAIRPTNGVIYSRKKLLSEVVKIRSLIKKKKLHLFGFSGISTFPKFAPLIDSFDTLAPLLYAAYGTILTDKPSSRKPKWLRYQSNSVKDVLKCSCPTCQEHGEKVMKSTPNGEGYRFLHNVWWLQKYYDKNSKNKQTMLNIPETS